MVSSMALTLSVLVVCVQGIPIPGSELIAVFDADQVAKRSVRPAHLAAPGWLWLLSFAGVWRNLTYLHIF